MTTRSRTGRLRRALLSRISVLKTPLNYDYYHYLVLGGYPSARRVRLYQRNFANSMHQPPQQLQRQQQQQQQQEYQQQTQQQKESPQVEMSPNPQPKTSDMEQTSDRARQRENNNDTAVTGPSATTATASTVPTTVSTTVTATATGPLSVIAIGTSTTSNMNSVTVTTTFPLATVVSSSLTSNLSSAPTKVHTSIQLRPCPVHGTIRQSPLHHHLYQHNVQQKQQQQQLHQPIPPHEGPVKSQTYMLQAKSQSGLQEGPVTSQTVLDEKTTKTQVGVHEDVGISQTVLKERPDKSQTSLNDKLDKSQTSLNDRLDKSQTSLNDRLDKSQTNLNERSEKSLTCLKERLEKSQTSLSDRLEKSQTGLNERSEKSLTNLRERLEKSQISLSEKLEKSQISLSEKLQKSQTSLRERLERSQTGLSERLERSQTGLCERPEKSQTSLSLLEKSQTGLSLLEKSRTSVVEEPAKSLTSVHEGSEKFNSYTASGTELSATQRARTGVSIEQLFENYSMTHGDSTSQYGTLGSGSGCQSDVWSQSESSQGGLGFKVSRAIPIQRAATAGQRRLMKVPVGVSISSVISNVSSSVTSRTLSLSCFSTSSSVDPPMPRKKSTTMSSNSSSIHPPSSTSSTFSKRGGDADGARQLLMGRREGSGYGKKLGAGAPNGAGGFQPMTGARAASLKEYEQRLTEREKAEIKNYRSVYYLGQISAKKAALEDGVQNEGFDDKDGFYICKAHDHIIYRYEIQELLGKGTFGQVVKALDHKTNSLVAMKIVKNERPFLRQAKEEVRILEVLRKQDKGDSQNVVHILDSFKWRGHACMSFELLGISLHQLLKKTRGSGFSLTRIQKITRGILKCLELLAKNRIIHCDVKPENILLRRSFSGVSATQGTFSDNSIKVIDFGSSCYEQQQIYTYIQSRYYRAPEVIMGARYSCAIDMWSLACVIGEMYTAHPLFAGDDEQDQLAAIMEIFEMPPLSLMGKCKRADKFFNGRTPRYLNQPNRRKPRGVPGSVSLSSVLKDTDDQNFLDFMQRALVWDPAQRMTASEALQHPWICRGFGQYRSIGHAKAVAAEIARSKEKIANIMKTSSNNGLVKPALSMGSSGNSTYSSNSSNSLIPIPSKLSTSKLPSHLPRPRSDTSQLGGGQRPKALHTQAIQTGGSTGTIVPAWGAS